MRGAQVAAGQPVQARGSCLLVPAASPGDSGAAGGLLDAAGADGPGRAPSPSQLSVSVLHGGAGWGREGRCSRCSDRLTMPHKANAACRHRIPRPKRRVTNWAEYDAALRQRGSLTVWLTAEAIAAWKAAPSR